MDLSTIEGLDDTQKQAILALYDTDIVGLKDKNSELLGKISDNKTAASASEQIVEDARKATVKAQQETLEAQGKYAEAKKLGEEERSKLIAAAESETNTVKSLLRERDIGDVRSDILAKVHDNFSPAAKAMLREAMEVEYNDEGKPTVSICLGDAKLNKADFLKQAETDPTWSAMLKAPDTQGTGASGSQGGQASGDDKDSAFKQRLRESGLTS
jgi:hypothetical protein